MIHAGVEEQACNLDITTASDVMQRQVASRISQVDDRIRAYELLRYCRVASVARHV